MKHQHVSGLFPTRRQALASLGGGLMSLAGGGRLEAESSPTPGVASEEQAARLQHLLRASVLDVSKVEGPLIIESMDLLRAGDRFLLRTRSRDGIEAITAPNPLKISTLYPIFIQLVAPVFVGRDARDLEAIVDEVYRHRSNYKMQGLALWVCVAAAEMGVLDLLGRASGRPLADFFGGTLRRDIAVYYASGNRGNTPEAEVEHLQKLVAGSGVEAIKYRVGGRMSRDADSLPGRTEALIPLVRSAFGDGMTLYTDSNSSYGASEAIRIGRLMEEHGYGFFEEPCEFDDLWSTRQVADALDIPIAGGEQEFSLHRWHWMIAKRGVDIVQPDLHYGGGFLRAVRVARMAEVMGMPVVPHMSGGGIGYVEVVQFASFVPNIGPFMEFKGNATFPLHCDSSSLKCENGRVRCPDGPGFGIEVDADLVARARPVSA